MALDRRAAFFANPKMTPGKPGVDPFGDAGRERARISRKRRTIPTLYRRIMELLETRRTDNKPGTRLDRAAEAYIAQMETGSFIHLKEIIDREEGKVPNRIANGDGTNIKAYVGVPVDGSDAP